MRETHWSLHMTVAWIASRSTDAVREQWDDYRAEQAYWSYTRWQHGPEGEVHEGWLLEDLPPATLSMLVMGDLWEVASDEASRASQTSDLPIRDARTALWDALKRGDIEASAIREGTAERAFIPAETWCDLEVEERRSRDYLVVSMGFGRTGAVFERVLFRKEDVLTVWPGGEAGLPNRTGAPGRPSSMHLIDAELKARMERGDTLPTLRLESEALADWFLRTYPHAARPTPKTIQNKIREIYRTGKAPK